MARPYFRNDAAFSPDSRYENSAEGSGIPSLLRIIRFSMEFPEGTYVYFVHSYYADTLPAFTIAQTEYICSYASAVADKNALDVQFHPEKNGAAGLSILRNFVAMTE